MVRNTAARSGSARAAAGRSRCASTDANAAPSPRSTVSISAEPVTSPASSSGATRPEMGSQRRKAPKSTMNRRPQTKLGIEIPRVPTPTAADSSQLRRRQTERTPRPMPPRTDSPTAARASSSVAGRRSRITRRASCWSQSERPKWPRSRPPKKARYCCHRDPLRPNCSRMRSMSCVVEPTGAISSAGSPGTILKIRKASTLTPQSERTARRSRLPRNRRDTPLRRRGSRRGPAAGTPGTARGARSSGSGRARASPSPGLPGSAPPSRRCPPACRRSRTPR